MNADQCKTCGDEAREKAIAKVKRELTQGAYKVEEVEIEI